MADETPSVDAVFCAAIEIESDEERHEYIAEACGEDAEFLQQVDRLLRAHYGAGSFLQSPPEGVATFPAIAQPITEKPGTQIGPYKLLQQIGEGGMGVVYMAEQTDPVKRRVALKVIKPGMDTRKVIARFEAERQALAVMDHPNIAKVLDAGTTNSGRPYFVMELVKGVPITEYCDQHQLSPRERLELFVPICQAVQHAHQKGIIHRDIKPSNVLVTEYDCRPVPKIIDFGVAKAIEQRLTEKTAFTEFGQVVGTPEYMSPEQAKLNEHDIDTRTDVYSLGVLLYELLTGDTPFDRKRLRSVAFDELLRIIREEEPPRPSLRLSTSESLTSIAANRHVDPKQLSAKVHGELDWIVMKALEKDRPRRYDTASKFAEDVQRYLNDEAVEACPPSAAYRFRKFARRNKSMIATTATIAAALLIGTGMATWQAIRATHERDRATSERNRAVAAEAKAAEEAERADSEAAIAKAVNDFLQNDLLGMTSSESQAEAKFSPDPNIKLRTVLDRAAETIEERFSDQPLVEAAIRHTIGEAYWSTGEYTKAEQHLQQAVEIRGKAVGPEDVETIRSMNSLANVYLRQSRYNEANAIYRQTLEIARRAVGDEHAATLAIMTNLANVYECQGRYDEAETLLRPTLRIKRRTLGAEHPGTLASMNNLANVYRSQGRYDEAEKLHRQTLEIRRRTLGEEHPGTLSSMNNLANVYRSQGRYDEAEKLHRQTLEIQRRTLGEEHPDTLLSMSLLAIAYERQWRYQEAETLHRETLEIKRRVLGEEHQSTLSSMNNLAIIYHKLGRNDEAETLHHQTLEIQRRTLGEEHPDTLLSMSNLAIVYEDQERHDEAAMLHRQTLDIRRRTLGEEHPDTLDSMISLADVYCRQGRYDEAETLHHRTVEIQRRTLGEEHPSTLGTMMNLANVHWSQNRYEAAEQLHLETLEIQKRKLGQEHPDTLLTMMNLANVYGSQGRFMEAEKLHRETLEIKRQTLGEEHPSTLRTMMNLAAVVYHNQGRHDEAETLFRQTLAAQERTLDPQHRDTKHTKGNLVALYSNQSWKAATSPNSAERDPEVALRAAKNAVELAPDNANARDKLGVALYRNDRWQEAIEALEKARELRKGGDPWHQFFLAMAYWQDGQQDEALANYQEAALWMLQGDRGEDQRRFQAEAEEVMGMSQQDRTELLGPEADKAETSGNDELNNSE